MLISAHTLVTVQLVWRQGLRALSDSAAAVVLAVTCLPFFVPVTRVRDFFLVPSLDSPASRAAATADGSVVLMRGACDRTPVGPSRSTVRDTCPARATSCPAAPRGAVSGPPGFSALERPQSPWLPVGPRPRLCHGGAARALPAQQPVGSLLPAAWLLRLPHTPQPGGLVQWRLCSHCPVPAATAAFPPVTCPHLTAAHAWCRLPCPQESCGFVQGGPTASAPSLQGLCSGRTPSHARCLSRTL